MGGELSKREGVLFHWWPFSSKQNDILQLFYTDISLVNGQNHHNIIGYLFETVFHQIFLSFLGVLLAVRGCTFMFRLQGVLAHPQNP